ncbi:MAG: hypothetical protein EPN17_02065 [Methylobacter sp.]|nr:MAG: hypothetical protein EPN17_02065 [Methylobacter sp.]
MKIEFDLGKINPDSKKFDDQLLREDIKNAIGIYATKLPEIYRGLDSDVLDNVTIHIVDASNPDDYRQEAFTKKRKLDNSEFIIAISQFNGPTDIRELLAHELCHIAQFLTGMIDDSVGNDSVIWEGERFVLSSIPHQKRPWEKDAIKNQLKLYGTLPDINRFQK